MFAFFKLDRCAALKESSLKTGVDNGVQTRDPGLGKLALCQPSCTRIRSHAAHFHTIRFHTIRQSEILPLLADLAPSQTGNGKNGLQ